MATGRPVIAPREGGPTEIVADGETGFLVPPRDPDALAARIVTLLQDDARRTGDGPRRARPLSPTSSTSTPTRARWKACSTSCSRAAPERGA
jgi:glycosyltransferase involved in cell wall biosynthesis